MTIREEAYFVEGEKRLGQYMAFLVVPDAAGDWNPAVMSLDAMVTNFRLLLRPSRKKYTPATLPNHYVRHVEMAVKGRHHCVAINLITGHELYITLGTGKVDDIYSDLRAMTAPRPKFAFDENVARRDIERLVSFFRDPFTHQPER